MILEAETVEPPAPGFFDGLRRLCDRHGALLILDEIITGFRWHERGAQFVYGIEPDLCTFGKGIANGFPMSALAGRREVMRLGGYRRRRGPRVPAVADGGRAAVGAGRHAGRHRHLSAGTVSPTQLHQIGAELRRNIEKVVADAGLSSHFQLRGRDCNLVYVARDEQGQPSQEFRTLVLQELLERGVLAPSFVVSAAHDPAAIRHTVDAVAETMPVYRRALEHGIGTVLRGRPVRPVMRPRG